MFKVIGSSLVVAALLLAVGSCGGGSSFAERDPGPVISQGELQQALFDELARLGKDPDKVTASAPSAGAEVFDLTGEAIDPDGAGPTPPNGVTLRWTDRLTGDYDNNGLVSIADLSMLGARFNLMPLYRDPATVNGFTRWPVGDPADAGSAGPDSLPDEGTGGWNWLLARVDGDGNGHINISDITPLAVHFGAQVDGYRVYRKAPGAADFELMANPVDANSPMSITRLSVTGGNNRRPVIYEFSDFFSTDGIYEYRVVPFCSNPDSEGQQSVSFWIDSRDGGSVGGGLSAVLSADVTSGLQPLAVNFDASLSTGVIQRFEWDFDGDGNYDRVTGNVPLTDFIYLNNATYNPVVRITDNKGAMDTASIQITVNSPSGNTPPSAALSADKVQGIVPLTVQFDGSGSIDLDGQILSHEWDFDGDGVFDMNTGTVPTAANTYNLSASYTAALRVTDDDGGTATATLAISAQSPAGNIPPLAAVTADVTSGNTPLTVNFSGAGSTDTDGTILIHEWDFDGDGTFDLNTGTVPTTAHTYTVNGQFQARLRVTDNDGSSASATVAIDTNPQTGGNQPPAVSIAATPTDGEVDFSSTGTPPNITYTNEGLEVDFTATASDPDGAVVKYEWDFEGDGIFDFTSGGTPQAQFSYKLAGTYTARVRVIDNNNAVGLSQALTISVSNRTPFVHLQFQPGEATGGGVETPLTLMLNTQGSVDIDGQIVKYEWDMNGDGQFTYGTFTDADTGQTLPTDIDSGAQDFISRVYSGPVSSRTDTFGVRVTDSGGEQTYVSVDVELQDLFDEVEQNDVVAQATPIANIDILPLALQGNMGGAQPDGYDGDEEDWYRISLPGPRSVDLFLDGFTSAIDLNMRVYAGDGTTLLASGLKPGHDEIRELIFLSSGTFFVRVTRFSGDELNDHDYTLTVDPNALPYAELEATDSNEENDTSSSAQFLSSFAPNGHLIDFYGLFTTSGNNSDDSDWYSWTLNGGIDLDITLDFRHLDADLDIYLVDSNGQTVASSTSNTDGESIFISHTDPNWHSGIWFVRVARAGGGAASYQLDLLGGGSQTMHTITGIARDELCCSKLSDGTDVEFEDINTSTVHTTEIDSAATGNTGGWTIDLPDGQYIFDIPSTGSKIVEDFGAGDIFIEDLPARVDIVNGDVIYKGTNATYFDITLSSPLETGVHT